MEGIVDRQVRQENLYKPGSWERGGWFCDMQQDPYAADTRPSNAPPQAAPDDVPPSDGVQIAAAVDDPGTKEEDESEQSREQNRLLEEQAKTNQESQPASEVEDPATTESEQS